ncbi:MAG: hypothetical protein HY826_11290 [Actinobacteria bacterium]|nr:hypothetical protein [Actinomycetota bacterium]
MPPNELDEQALVAGIKTLQTDIGLMKGTLQDLLEGSYKSGTQLDALASKSAKERERDLAERRARIDAATTRLAALIAQLADLRTEKPAPADAIDTGHYDDGHSLQWTPKPTSSWTNLTTGSELNETVDRIEQQLGDDSHSSAPSGHRVWLPVLLVATVAVAGGLTLLLRGGDDSPATEATTPVVAGDDTAATAGPTLPVVLPTVCSILDAATVGQIVGGRPMTTAPDASGKGCLFTATDEPNIDLSTPYPPYISQVSVTFNAPQPGLTAEQVGDLFETSRPATAIDVPGPAGGQAYSSGGGSAVVLDRGVMILCGTSGTVRPESIPDVQAMCIQIASALRAALP